MEVESSPLGADSPAFRHVMGKDIMGGSPSKKMGKNIFGPKLAATEGLGADDSRLCSPTTTLAADLSQNFHIDKTPQIPTPRRSLFGALGVGFKSTMGTPPITSSPVDSMDISPLPHKTPFSAIRDPVSPTKGQDSQMSLCSSPLAPSPCNMAPKRSALVDRKRLAPRPNLVKNARFASNPNFKIIPPAMSRSATAPQINLEELFGASSPDRSRKLTSPRGNMMMAPPTRPSEANNGSPVMKDRTNRAHKPRGKIRRTLSMFNPGEKSAANDDEDINMEAPKLESGISGKCAAGETPMLPSFNVRDDPLRRISVETMVDVMSGKYEDQYDELIIVDCRFEYEYEGGHIKGAVNYNAIDDLETAFQVQEGPRDPIENKRRLIIFHCEFSAHRAPRMALHLRKRDRHINMKSYPALSYPDVYVLNGGYCAYWQKGDRSKCEPMAYIEMNDKAHVRTCEKEMGKFRRNTKFTRTQSYTYGALSTGSSSMASLDDSPSANLAGKRGSMLGGDQGTPTGPGGLKSRRMASY